MPVRHGIEVRVLTTAEKPLVEYGGHSIGQTSKLVSTRVEAVSGQQFYVRVRPTFPFPFKDLVDTASENVSQSLKTERLRTHDHNLRFPRPYVEDLTVEGEADSGVNAAKRITRSISASGQLWAGGESSKTGAQRRSSLTKSLLWSTPKGKAKLAFAPFDLIASVYIDGRSKPECRQVIYLDPRHPRFKRRGVVFKGRWAAVSDPQPHPIKAEDEDVDGEKCIDKYVNTDEHIQPRVEVRNWVFADVGIELLLSRMGMSNDDVERYQTETEREMGDLVSSLTASRVSDPSSISSTADKAATPAAAVAKIGQIEVRIRRVIVGEARTHDPFKPYHYAGGDEDVSVGSACIGENTTHTTRLQAAGGHIDPTTKTGAKELEQEQERLKLNTIPWTPYKAGEEFYAKFIFSYMSRAKLVKLGLCRENGEPMLATLPTRVTQSPERSSIVHGGGGKRKGKDDGGGREVAGAKKGIFQEKKRARTGLGVDAAEDECSDQAKSVGLDSEVGDKNGDSGDGV